MKQNRIPATFRPFSVTHSSFGAGIRSLASGFDVNGDCVSCGICRDVCLAENVALGDSGPVFGGRCESCVACIQHCPRRAINLGAKTKGRGRYVHPRIGHPEILRHYGRLVQSRDS